MFLPHVPNLKNRMNLSASQEWLETDGLGGFASGTSTGIRTRRYHALLLAATTPPTGRMVLVNGFDAWIETPAGRFELTSQHYAPDVIGGEGAQRIEQFTADPWPRWTFKFEDGTRIEQEILVARESQVTQVAWRLLGKRKSVRLFVRPFLSGRDYHSLHKDNPAFRFDATVEGERIIWNPYPGVPAVVALSNGHYQHEPHWYRNFRYAEEAARGLDDTEDLAAPGVFDFDLASGDAVLMFTTADSPALSRKRDLSAVRFADAVRANEEFRRAEFSSRLHRAADAYIVNGRNGRTIMAGKGRQQPYAPRLGATEPLWPAHNRFMRLLFRFHNSGLILARQPTVAKLLPNSCTVGLPPPLPALPPPHKPDCPRLAAHRT